MIPVALAGAALGLGAVKAGFDLFSGFDKARYQRQLGAEQRRRYMLDAEKKVSEATAVGGEASGITADSSSLTTYIDGMQAEFKRQADWITKSAEQGASASELGGIFGAVGDLGGSLFQFGASQNWFKTPSAP